MATDGERVSLERRTAVPRKVQRSLPAPTLDDLQRLIGNRALGRLLSAGDRAAARTSGAVLQRKLTRGDNWVAGYSLAGYWTKEQVDAEFVKLGTAHAQLNVALTKARETLPDEDSDALKAFKAVDAVWNAWDRKVNWSERATCLTELTDALKDLNKIQPTLLEQRHAEDEAAEQERLESERQAAEKLKQQKAVVKPEQPKGKQPKSKQPQSGAVAKTLVGKTPVMEKTSSDKALPEETPSEETPDVESVQQGKPLKTTPQPVKQQKLKPAEKRQLKKQRDREQREQEDLAKRKADQAAEEEAVKIQKEHAVDIQKVVADAQARGLNLKLHGLLKKLDDMQQAKKPNWQTIVEDTRTLPAALASDVEKVKNFDEQQRKAFEKGFQTCVAKRDLARKDAPPRKIPLTKLEESMKKLIELEQATDLQQAMPSEMESLNKAVAEAKAEADAVLTLVEAADEYEAEKTAVKERLEGARTLEHSEVDEKSLALAMKVMEERETRHQELLKADEPDWLTLRSALHNLDAAITKTFRSVIKSQPVHAVTGDDEPNEQEAIDLAVDALGDDGDWEEEVTKRSGKWGAYYGNGNGYLPVGNYKEYYVKPPAGDKWPGARRLVVDDKQRMFYTWTHYGEHAAPGEPAYVRLT